MYKPDLKDLLLTELADQKPDIVLDVRNMRSNPKIGPAILSINSNLDGRIKPSSVLDISQLFTAGTSTDSEVLEVANNFLKNSVAGFTKYQALTVQPSWIKLYRGMVHNNNRYLSH
jgi:hypothetical protein